jgi:ankyrin repeat protein
MFVSVAETTDQKSIDIFEALDLGDDAVDYFKEKCEELPIDTLIKLRDKRLGNEGRTLLHNASRRGVLPAVLYLLSIGHPIELYDCSLTKKTALMDAIEARNIEIAIVLVEAGAKLSTADINQENAFHYAARSGSSRIIKWMIKAANLSLEEIKESTSATNIRLRFPEDLAKNSLTKGILVNYRVTGNYVRST